MPSVIEPDIPSTELLLRGRGGGFAQATMNMAPGYFQRKMKEK